MGNFVAFTYDERPKKAETPFWDASMGRDKPCAVFFSPTIGCTAEQFERGSVALTSPNGLPWNDINIAEVVVESRKAYEVLCRIAPPNWQGTVRINPPKVSDFRMMSDAVEKNSLPDRVERPNISIFADTLVEMRLASEIAAGMERPDECCISTGNNAEMIRRAEMTIFVCRCSHGAGYLASAIANGCHILTSDAGASEEYLSRFAPPGTWHVCRLWKADPWIQMYRHLAGHECNVKQTALMDLTPYIKTEAGR